LTWHHGVGFPKSHNLGNGWGTALKPATEFIVCARKPLSEPNIAANVRRWGTGGLNINGTRVVCAGGSPAATRRETSRRTGTVSTRPGTYDRPLQDRTSPERYIEPHEGESIGRWPPNLLLSHHPDCQPVGTRRVKVAYSQPTQGPNSARFWGMSGDGQEVGYADADGYEVVEVYQCVGGCPVAMLDRQSGESASRAGNPRSSAQPGNGYGMTHTGAEYDDEGGASRFFPRFFYCAKASTAERNAGLDALPDRLRHRIKSGGMERDPRWAPIVTKNTHPTCKPVALMRWLVTLITPPGGTVLDPFLGSGSTGIAAVTLGFDFAGIELEEEYADIARARIEHAERVPGLFTPTTERRAIEAGQLGLFDGLEEVG
jgi:hypothetical protein